MARILRIGASFLVVLGAYWLYALAAVPLIEPPAERLQSAEPTEAERQMAAQRLAGQVEELQGLFAPGSWELENPKILESDQVKLLLRDYANLGDGRVEIRPCTIIFTPKDDVDPVERNRRSVILQAPEGARLEFDEPFDLRRARIGRLTSGHLVGQITIRSAGRSPGSEDDLHVVTRSVELTADRIWTPHAVEFRLGPNYGRGEQMHVKMLPSEESAPTDHGPNIAGVELFEIRRLQSLHLEPAALDRARAGRQSQPDSPSTWQSQSPVEVSCQGPFRFDPVRQVATFENNVAVFLVSPDGPSDQLNCELLSVYFAQPRSEAPVPAGKPAEAGKLAHANPSNLHPRRLEARGKPVVIVSRTRDAQVRGERVEYDLETEQISLDGGADQEAFLRQGPNEIHARSVQYQSAGPGRIGRLVAQGPGWLRAERGEGRAQQLSARWKEVLRLRPDGDQQAISLYDGAELDYAGLGRLTAAQIHFWFDELPAEAAKQRGQPPVQPGRMLAVGEVKLTSQQMSGEVNRMEVWFEPIHAATASTPAPAAAAAVPSARISHHPGQRIGSVWRETACQLVTAKRQIGGLPNPGEEGEVVPVAAALPIAAPASPPAVTGVPSGAATDRHFDLAGNLVRSRVAMRNDTSEVLELVIDGNVRLEETQTAQPGERPMILTGDQIHLLNANQPHAEVTVTGRPAHFEARGLGLTGNNINLNRGTNRLWIDGPGRMDLPVDRDLEGRPLAEPVSLNIYWQRRMDFDGLTVSFQESVVAESQDQSLRTETLDVRLRETIRFGEAGAPSSGQPQVEQIACHGGAIMKNLSFEGENQTSSDEMQVADLVLNLDTGETLAQGPGSMTSVHRGSFSLAGVSPTGVPVAGAGSAAGQTPDELSYLNVRFQDKLTGNLRHRAVTFHEQVRAAYGPVRSWDETLDPEKPETFGPRGLLLNCDQLSVSQIDVPLENRKAVGLVAQGNILVEGSSYYARAARMSYAQDKDLLILEGDGRSEAELYHQKSIGGPMPKATARRILYWPSTRRLQVDGARSVELSPLPGR